MKYFVTLCFVLLMTSCVPEQSTSTTTSVVLWSYRPQEQVLWLRVNQENWIPGVKVDFVLKNNDGYEQGLLQAFSDGTGPDILTGKTGSRWLQQFIDPQYLATMESLNVSVDNIIPASLPAVRAADGQIYGVPHGVQLLSIIYNSEAIESLGLGNPTNLEEFTELLKAAHAKGLYGLAIAGQADWRLYLVFHEVALAGLVAEQELIALVDGRACYTDSIFVEALETILSWLPYSYAQPTKANYGQMRGDVATGDALMMLDGSWSSGPASPIYELNPDLKLGFMAIPGSGAKSALMPDGGYLVNANSHKLDAVARVMAFATTEQFGQLFNEEVSEITSVRGQYMVASEVQTRVLSEALNTGSVNTYAEHNLNHGQPSYSDLVAKYLPELMDGKITATEMARAVQEGLNSWKYIGAKHCALAP